MEKKTDFWTSAAAAVECSAPTFTCDQILDQPPAEKWASAPNLVCSLFYLSD